MPSIHQYNAVCNESVNDKGRNIARMVSVGRPVSMRRRVFVLDWELSLTAWQIAHTHSPAMPVNGCQCDDERFAWMERRLASTHNAAHARMSAHRQRRQRQHHTKAGQIQSKERGFDFVLLSSLCSGTRNRAHCWGYACFTVHSVIKYIRWITFSTNIYNDFGADSDNELSRQHKHGKLIEICFIFLRIGDLFVSGRKLAFYLSDYLYC